MIRRIIRNKKFMTYTIWIGSNMSQLLTCTICLNTEVLRLSSEASSNKNRHAPNAKIDNPPINFIDSTSPDLLEIPVFVLLFSND